MKNDERQFEELLNKVTFDDKPDYRHRDKLHQELLAAFAGRQWREERQSRQIGVWRTIMQSGFDKLTTGRTMRLAAVAAVIAIVGVASWVMYGRGGNEQISPVEFLAKVQASENALFTGDRIVHILSEITIYRSNYNPKTDELIAKLSDPGMTGEERMKLNRELVSTWMVGWLPMGSLQADGQQRLTEIRLSRDSNQPYTIFDNAWYEPQTGRFVRTMELDDKVLFANSYDGDFVNITETAPDGKVQMKSEAVTSDFKAPENPAEFLGMTAGVRQCLVDKCFVQPVQEVVNDALDDGTPVFVYKVGFPDPWGELNTYYLFKIRRADEIIAEIEYIYTGNRQMLIRRVVSEQVDKPGYTWNLAELSSKELAGQTPSAVTVGDFAIDNVSVRHMIDKAEFETYIFATDPNWTKQRMIVDVVDAMNPPARMFVILYYAKEGDNRHVLMIQSPTNNKYLGTMLLNQSKASIEEAKKQGLNLTEFANGCKVYRNTGGEAFWTDLSFRNSGFEPAKDRVGLIVSTPAGTFPMIAVNGALTEEELTGLINSLIPAKDYQVK